ncbi:Fe(3+) ions import ATP-binding protein FbpC [Oceanisphaera marina]|uniref:Fe(3+) ions import ATP-binding protein FbpC n=1 Tax=Oceanisphaera marina TaxID=2017550 RepID=A0ABQ1IGP7_9GAMM|nr:ABC transporter ATP-binding protein [Oceanisphaera marina]GGB37248.1 Fe(3+) ions import ATP-binding protein FbpC [Oceanisphaera marina]
MKKLIIQHVSKQFADVHALHNVSLELEEGSMLAVLGPSGCGKTTLLRSIAGFETPDAGSITIDGHTVFNGKTNIKPEQRKIGYVPQHGVLFPHLSVEKNIAFGLSGSGQPYKEQKAQRVAEMLQLVGMAGLGKRLPHELSGGQQQRVALARALAPAPSLVLLDEPFSALDAGLRMALREEVTATLNQIGTTAILVTHDQEEALSMADRVAVMRRGRCVQIADPVSLYKYPADIQVARFVGEAVTLTATIDNGHAHSCFGPLPLAPGCPLDSTSATIMIRPEQFVPGAPAEQQLTGHVVKTIYYGHNALVHIKTDARFGAQDIQMRVSGAHTYAPGDVVGLKIVGEVMAY